MPDLRRMMIHTCVYWAPTGVGTDGQATFAAPVQLCCRWLEMTEMYQDRAGNSLESKARVRLLTDVEELGVLWKGCLADLTSRTSPFDNADAWEIRRFNKVYSRSGEDCLRIALL